MDPCQRASYVYGIGWHSQEFSSAPGYVRQWFSDYACVTDPQGTDPCQKAADLYGIYANQTWGFAPPDVQTWWTANGCTTASNNTDPQLCKNAANFYAMDSDNFGNAPQEAQTWWQQMGCNAEPTCQGLSEMFGIDYDPWYNNGSYGYAEDLPDIQNWWVDHECRGTAPLFEANPCQRASDKFAIGPNGDVGFAPDFVRTFWSSSQCDTSPRPVSMFIPDVDPMAPPVQPPAAPTNLVVTSVDDSQIHFSFQDHNNASLGYFPSLEVFEVLSDGREFFREYDYGAGSLGGVRTGEAAVLQLYNGKNSCIKIRYLSAYGRSMFSNVACGGTASMPSSTGCGVGLGNGVHVTNVDYSDWNYFPGSFDEFRIAWYVCNSCMTWSPALTVALAEYSSGNTLQDTTYFPLAGVPPGQCILQSSEPMSTYTSFYMHWDVFINGSWQGGTGMSTQ
jgi:hypothetical protein